MVRIVAVGEVTWIWRMSDRRGHMLLCVVHDPAVPGDPPTQICPLLQSGKPTRDVWVFCPDRTNKSYQASRLQGATAFLHHIFWKPWINVIFLTWGSFLPGLTHLRDCSGCGAGVLRVGIFPRRCPDTSFGRQPRSTRCRKPITQIISCLSKIMKTTCMLPGEITYVLYIVRRRLAVMDASTVT